MSEFSNALREGAARMGVELDALALERMEAFHRLLAVKNEHMNLTAVTQDAEALDRHYLDSLAVLKFGWLRGEERLADVGTGAGFPGMPLLIARPGLRLTFVDSLEKRLAFLREALERLGLQALCVHLRAEDFGRSPKHRQAYDLATARAVAPLPVLMEYLLPCLRLGGVALCWKGPGVEQERAEKAAALLGGGQVRLFRYEIPGRDWGHLLVRVEKQGQTPEKYPRKAGLPSKKPL